MAALGELLGKHPDRAADLERVAVHGARQAVERIAILRRFILAGFKGPGIGRLLIQAVEVRRRHDALTGFIAPEAAVCPGGEQGALAQRSPAHVGQRCVRSGLPQVHGQVAQDLLKAVRTHEPVRADACNDARHRGRSNPLDGEPRHVGKLHHALAGKLVRVGRQGLLGNSSRALDPQHCLLRAQRDLCQACQLVGVLAAAAGLEPLGKHAVQAQYGAGLHRGKPDRAAAEQRIAIKVARGAQQVLFRDRSAAEVDCVAL